jgi:hypothetical protein
MPMGIDDTEERHSNLILGILIVAVATIFVAFALGIGGTKLFSQNKVQPVSLGFFSEEDNKPELQVPNVENTVSVANGGCIEMDTEAGSIEIDSANLPAWEVLPLCITNNDLIDYYVTLRVTGGYTPECGQITFYQKDELKGTIDVNWAHVGHEPCYADYWTATFTTATDIELESNQWPVIPDDFYFSSNYDIVTEKKVTVCLCTKWTGCHFWIILVHKIFSESPNSQ